MSQGKLVLFIEVILAGNVPTDRARGDLCTTI